MGKQLVNFITCGCESSAPFLQFTKPGANPRRIGDRLVWTLRSSDLTHWATGGPLNVLMIVALVTISPLTLAESLILINLKDIVISVMLANLVRSFITYSNVLFSTMLEQNFYLEIYVITQMFSRTDEYIRFIYTYTYWLHWVDTLTRIGKFIGPQITCA
jgi:hypothetical protein